MFLNSHVVWLHLDCICSYFVVTCMYSFDFSSGSSYCDIDLVSSLKGSRCFPLLIQCVTLTGAVTPQIWFNPISLRCSLTWLLGLFILPQTFGTTTSRMSVKGFSTVAHGEEHFTINIVRHDFTYRALMHGRVSFYLRMNLLFYCMIDSPFSFLHKAWI